MSDHGNGNGRGQRRMIAGLVEVWSARDGGGDADKRDQERVYDFIRMHEAIVDRPIRLADIQRGLGMEPVDVLRHLAALVDADKVEFVAGRWVREESRLPVATARG